VAANTILIDEGTLRGGLLLLGVEDDEATR
jgi:hypothetical protein